MKQTMVGKIAALAGLLGMTLAACSSGVSQKDYDAVKQQLATAQQQAQSAQAGGQQVTALQQQLAAKDKEIADLKKGQGTTQGKTPLIWTEAKPLPPLAPTATPRPPGFVAPTPVPPPASLVNEVLPFTFYIEHLTGHQTSEVVQFPSCVPNSQFRRGAHLVWRFEVFDTSTGKRLTSLDTPTVKVVLPNGQEIAARFAQRGGTGPWTWVAAWDVPSTYPLGTLDYQIVVKSKDGRTGTFDQDPVALVLKDRGIDSRIQIVE